MNRFIVHPGRYLQRTLKTLGITQKELAHKIELSERHLSEICNGKKRLTPQTAGKLERVLPVPAETWVELQTRWDLRADRGERTWDEFLDELTADGPWNRWQRKQRR